MKPKDIFGVAVRIIGLAFLYQTLSSVPRVLMNIFQSMPTAWHAVYLKNFCVSFLFSVIDLAWPLCIAIWMLRGAPWLMRLAYRNEQNPLPPSASSTSTPAERL